MQSNFEKHLSDIHGFGMFATRAYNLHDVVYLVPINNVSETPKKRWAYISNNKWASDPIVLNYVNHSCDPSCILDITNEPKLIAIKNVLPGEEITVDYNKTEQGGTPVPCTCQSTYCKQFFLRKE